MRLDYPRCAVTLGLVELLPLMFLFGPVLTIWALVDLLRRPEVALKDVGFNRVVWALIIVLVGFFGPIAYLAFGRKQLDATTASGPVDSVPVRV